jgi:uncharacterized membrane protein
MVLELKAPHGTDGAQLLALWPVLLSYALSFAFVAIYWINHHTLLHDVRHVGVAALWSNMALLFVLSLTPFATAYLGENEFGRLPVLLYALLQFACAACYWLLAGAIAAQHRGDAGYEAHHRAETPKNLVSLGLYTVACVVALLVPWLSLLILAGIGLSYVIPTAFWRKETSGGA